MENFLCENPLILQDAAKFGWKSWVIPFAILCLGLRGMRHAWLSEKQFHAKLSKNKNLRGNHKPRFPWIEAGIFGTAFLAFSFFNLHDRAIKLNALENAEYRTYQGYVDEIYNVDRRRGGWITGRLGFKIRGYAMDADGRRHKLNRYNESVTTKRAIVADWGNNCSGYSCGLSVGKKVRIKQLSGKTYYGGDTLSIEKCEMP